MLKLNRPQKMWGVAHENTATSGRLFTDETFTYRHQAVKYINDIMKEFKEEAGDIKLSPVLLNITTSMCTDEEANAYHTEQIDKMDKKDRIRRAII